jgi:N-methylhydantoinase B
MTHITPSTPVEVLETEYALRMRRYDLWADSAGPGRHRGGFGYVREYELLDACTLTVRGSNQAHAAPGLDGGGSPVLSRATLNPGSPAERAVGILETHQLVKGDVIRFEKTGGSGLGSPLERPVDDVVGDVRNGYVSVEAAREVYGVTIDELGGHRR